MCLSALLVCIVRAFKICSRLCTLLTGSSAKHIGCTYGTWPAELYSSIRSSVHLPTLPPPNLCATRLQCSCRDHAEDDGTPPPIMKSEPGPQPFSSLLKVLGALLGIRLRIRAHSTSGRLTSLGGISSISRFVVWVEFVTCIVIILYVSHSRRVICH